MINSRLIWLTSSPALLARGCLKPNNRDSESQLIICNDSLYVNDTIATVGSGDFLSKSQFHYSVIQQLTMRDSPRSRNGPASDSNSVKGPAHKMPINCHPLAYLHQFWGPIDTYRLDLRRIPCMYK